MKKQKRLRLCRIIQTSLIFQGSRQMMIKPKIQISLIRIKLKIRAQAVRTLKASLSTLLINIC